LLGPRCAAAARSGGSASLSKREAVLGPFAALQSSRDEHISSKLREKESEREREREKEKERERSARAYECNANSPYNMFARTSSTSSSPPYLKH